jgi:hypothetical protein
MTKSKKEKKKDKTIEKGILRSMYLEKKRHYE